MKMKNGKGETFLFVAGNESTLKRLNKRKKVAKENFFRLWSFKCSSLVPPARLSSIHCHCLCKGFPFDGVGHTVKAKLFFKYLISKVWAAAAACGRTIEREGEGRGAVKVAEEEAEIEWEGEGGDEEPSL